jgi:hypothetical protein
MGIPGATRVAKSQSCTAESWANAHCADDANGESGTWVAGAQGRDALDASRRQLRKKRRLRKKDADNPVRPECF